ncbi:formate dehydrogenase accessory sulfurtransferase FdhD [Flavobacterium sp. UMI-01]|uniref:formate dehydrogenase accessory sulfurtransferase FdhD n=1 Tax=Flavobacterium sp. UMI-01 TaxID=1441053 RepID=UPI001C7CF570|nr:formate dehydrogenase accessory sulfurtransferase FdhD [Flavobacterium sp. UMI-01]
MQSILYEGLKRTDATTTKINDFLVVEAPLEISINQSSFTVVMRTPGNDFELIRGLLHAEDIYRSKEHPKMEVVSHTPNAFTKIEVTIPKEQLGNGYMNKRSLLSVSSCGICGKQQLDDFKVPNAKLRNQHQIDLEKLPEMFAIMSEHQQTFSLTGGSHAAVVFSESYEFLTLKEDIGRHNAVDKCIGDLIQSDRLKLATFMLVSGRVSYEIITKAFFAKISTIVAVSACSSLAVDYAKEFGICLIGFSRDNKATIYSTN